VMAAVEVLGCETKTINGIQWTVNQGGPALTFLSRITFQSKARSLSSPSQNLFPVQGKITIQSKARSLSSPRQDHFSVHGKITFQSKARSLFSPRQDHYQVQGKITISSVPY
jgi:hypothetical protein